MKTLIRIFVFIFLMVSAATLLGSKYPYPDVADQLVKEVISVFVNHKLCADIHECRREEFAFRGGTPGHAVVFVFNIERVSDLLIRDIIGVCTSAYYSQNMKVTIELKAYAEEREEVVKWFSGSKPAVHLILRGER
ncbi:MAG TPA: hypothetical protein PK725_01050 [Rhodocyclaceae bacterium]|nr:hypothetical protein [Rhodocyclaceae bacterium]HRQ45501.1 hypothetical protein [Rhodocyclaceae bacterium]